jgi:hypothetical protein
MSDKIFDSVGFLREILNMGACSNDTPKGITGNTKYSNLRAASMDMYSTIKLSVDTGKCCPCCSSEPTGIIADLPCPR